MYKYGFTGGNVFFITGFDHVDYDKTTVQLGYNNPTAVPLPRKHTFGYFKELEDVKKAVEGNEADIHERGYYKFVVIEKIDEGYCYPTADDVVWYMWALDIEQYIQIPKPKSTEKTCNFAF